MAPEQPEHPAAADHRADIYSLGVVFYQMLTGELPGKPIEPPSRKGASCKSDGFSLNTDPAYSSIYLLNNCSI